jgi:hypothetical protein
VSNPDEFRILSKFSFIALDNTCWGTGMPILFRVPFGYTA